MSPAEYRAFMEEYFQKNHILDRDREKWEAGTKQLLGSEKASKLMYQEQNPYSNQYQQKINEVGSLKYDFQESETYTETHRMCEECYTDSHGYYKDYNKYLLIPLEEQEPCHYCFQPTRFKAAIEEDREECSFLHEVEDE